MSSFFISCWWVYLPWDGVAWGGYSATQNPLSFCRLQPRSLDLHLPVNSGRGISGPREVTWPGLTYHSRRATWLVIGSGVDKWPQLIQSEWSSGIWGCNPEKVLFLFPGTESGSRQSQRPIKRSHLADESWALTAVWVPGSDPPVWVTTQTWVVYYSVLYPCTFRCQEFTH